MWKRDNSGSGRLTELNNVPRRILKRALPAVNPGWMLTFSLFFAAIVILSMRALDIICSALITSSGYAALTSSNILYFFRTWQGYAVTALFAVFMCVTAGIILNGVIFLSYDILCQKRIRLLPLLKKSVLSIRLFLHWNTVSIVLYYFVFVLFFTMSLLSIVPNPFEIPGYLRYLLSKKLLTMVLYLAALILISIPLLRNPLLLHDMLLKQEGPHAARARTRAFVKTNRRILFRELLLSVIVFGAILLCAAALFLYGPLLAQTVFSFLPAAPRRVLILISTYASLINFVIISLLALWIIPVKTSMLYYVMLHGSKPLPPVRQRRPFFRYIFPVYLAVVAAAVVVSFIQFNYLYPPAKYIEAVVHRLGGSMDTENTLEGMDKALEMGACAMETDIQRTLDGEYVIFHDSTLRRMCGIKTRINQMTLEQVRDVQLPSPDWNERHIPLLSEVLDRAKGRARLYLELKGADADEKMVRDVVKMVRERGMEDECVLISLNYSLVDYISRNIHVIPCGYLYFFAYGRPGRLSGNLLMAQSNAINARYTKAIHSMGKKVFCWTVNSRKTALNMVRQRVDGIISDRYDIVESVLSHMESRSDYERIMDVLLS